MHQHVRCYAVLVDVLAVVSGVLAHCAEVCWEPAKPPTRVWTSQSQAGRDGDARFHLIRMAPA